jgi:hypothetical protein
MRNLVGPSQIGAYLVMMTARLVELHRVLKPTGSLYLHCDPTASHYLKTILDAIFGPTNYRNEIIWRRTGSHNSARRFGPIHDVIHFYTKSDAYRFNVNYGPYLNVKGGATLNPGMVRDLRGTIEREHAEMGVLLTISEPTRGIREEADKSGSYTSELTGQAYPRIQVLTVADLMSGRRPRMPTAILPYLKAQPRAAEQLELG